MSRSHTHLMPAGRRVAIFIDGVEFDETLRCIDGAVDYRKLLGAFQEHGRLLRAYYYAPTDEQALISMRPLLDWLTYNGYQVRVKGDGEHSERRSRQRSRSMSIELAVDVLELAPHLDTIVLITGDDAFKPLVAAVQARGITVSVVSTLKSKPAMVGNALRRQADEFIEIVSMLPRIALERRL